MRDTLNVILKYEADIKKAQSELGRLITRKEAPAAAAAPGAAPTAAAPAAQPQAATAKKGVLH